MAEDGDRSSGTERFWNEIWLLSSKWTPAAPEGRMMCSVCWSQRADRSTRWMVIHYPSCAMNHGEAPAGSSRKDRWSRTEKTPRTADVLRRNGPVAVAINGRRRGEPAGNLRQPLGSPACASTENPASRRPIGQSAVPADCSVRYDQSEPAP